MTIATPYPYVDGTVLDPDQHNRNVYSVTPGEGILSEPNGGIDNTCLDATFRVYPESVQTEECTMARGESNKESIDYIDNAFSSSTEPQTTVEREFIPIAGTGIRFPLHFGGLILFQWTLFVSPHRPQYWHGDVATGYSWDHSLIVIKTYYNGSPIAHTRRTVPLTAFYNDRTTADPNDTGNMMFHEDRACRTFDMAHLVTGASRGWQSLSVRIFMEQSDMRPSFWRKINGTPIPEQVHIVRNRLTVGIRNVRALCLLEEA